MYGVRPDGPHPIRTPQRWDILWASWGAMSAIPQRAEPQPDRPTARLSDRRRSERDDAERFSQEPATGVLPLRLAADADRGVARRGGDERAAGGAGGTLDAAPGRQRGGRGDRDGDRADRGRAD